MCQASLQCDGDCAKARVRMRWKALSASEKLCGQSGRVERCEGVLVMHEKEEGRESLGRQARGNHAACEGVEEAFSESVIFECV